MAKVIGVGPDGYPTIGEAILAASDFDIIKVASGSYNEILIINKSITLLGAASGINPLHKDRHAHEETLLSAASPIGIVQLLAPNIVIDGFTIEGNVEGPGIFTSFQYSGYLILNNIIKENAYGIHLNTKGDLYTHVKQNILHKNNRPGQISGNGVYTDEASSNIHLSNNLFTGHQPAASINLIGKAPASGPSNILITNNEMLFDNSILLTNTRNVAIIHNKISNTLGSAIFIGGGTNNTIIESNAIVRSLTNGIYINDFFSSSPNEGLRIINNSIIGNQTAGLNITSGAYRVNADEGKLQACLNWWLSAKGPVFGSDANSLLDPDGLVDVSPYLTEAPVHAMDAKQQINPSIRLCSSPLTTIVADDKETAVMSRLGLSKLGRSPVKINNLPKTWPELRDYIAPNNALFKGEPDFIWPQLSSIGGERKYFSTKYDFLSQEAHIIFISTFADNCHRLFLEERNRKTGKLIKYITPAEGLTAGDMQPNAGTSSDTEAPYSWQRVCQFSNVFTPSSVESTLVATFEVVNYYAYSKFNPAALAFTMDVYSIGISD